MVNSFSKFPPNSILKYPYLGFSLAQIMLKFKRKGQEYVLLEPLFSSCADRMHNLVPFYDQDYKPEIFLDGRVVDLVYIKISESVPLLL